MPQNNVRKSLETKGASLPLCAVVSLLLLSMMGTLMALFLCVPDTVFEFHMSHAKTLIIAGAMALEVFLCTVLVQWLVAARIQTLTNLLSEDVVLVAADPGTFKRLAQLPALGVSEVNNLQIAMEQLYFVFSEELQRQGIIPDVSYGEGATGGEVNIGVWRIPEDDDEGKSSQDLNYGNPALTEFLLSRRERYRRGLINVLSLPAETGSRATTFMRGLFGSVPRPVNRSTQAEDNYFGFSHSAGTHQGTVLSASREGTLRKGSMFSVQSYPSSTGLLAEEENRFGYAAVEEQLRSVTPLNEVERDECDPLGDNVNNKFEVLANSLRLESAIIFQVLRSIRVGRSLSSITLPVHILESRSLLEMLSDMFVSWDLLLPIATGEATSPVDRMRVMLRWFLSAYHWRPKGGAKKPYNPILGEVFQCKHPGPNVPPATLISTTNATTATDTALKETIAWCSTGRPMVDEGVEKLNCMRFMAEQVSHRPPVSVFYAELPNIIVAHGVYMPRSKLVSPNCAASISCASVVVQFPQLGCEYSFNLPNAYATGVIAGTPRLELGGTVRIQDRHSQTHATVNFLRKAFFGGQHDEVVATINEAEGQTPAEEYTGLWHGTVAPRSCSGPVIKSDALFDVEEYQITRGSGCERPHAFPIAGGHPKQSRVVWRDLTAAIRRQDTENAARAKFTVEETQRAERRRLEAAGTTHTPTFFQFKQPNTAAHASEDLLGKLENWTFIGRGTLFQ